MSEEKGSIDTGGGAYITGKVEIHGGDFIGRDQINIYQGPAYARPNYRSDVSDILAFYTATFVGRTQEQAELMAFAAREAPGYRLLKALSGYGKSALMARLIHLHETGRWVGEAKPHLLYYFVRQQGGHNTPERFLQAVNAQLLDLCHLPGGVPPERNALSSQWSQLWTVAVRGASAATPLLLVVDGLDEMAGGEVTIADLLPAHLGPYVHVVVTSRPQPDPLEQVRLEHPLRGAEVWWLGAFDVGDVEKLLREVGASAEAAKHLALRVLEATQGQPLFARFVSQDVAAQGEAVLARLEADPPAGVAAYFKEQLRQLDETAEGDLTWDILGLMVMALGGLSADELAGVLAVGKRRVRKALEPVRRYLLGEERLTLMHEQLREVLAGEFSEGEQGDLRGRLLTYCAKWPEHRSGYSLAHYAEHLVEAGLHEELYALIDRPWMEAQVEGTTSHRAFARDVDLAIAAASGEEPTNWVPLVRGCLLYATLGSMATQVPPETLGLLARLGQVDRAVACASLIPEAEKQCRAYLLIAESLPAQSKPRKAKPILEQALAIAQAIGTSKQVVGRNEGDRQLKKVSLLSAVARALIEMGDKVGGTAIAEQALTVAEAISDGVSRARALSEAAQSLARAGQADRATAVAYRALSAAQAAGDEGEKVLALSKAAQALVRMGQTDRAAEAAYEALAAAEDTQSELHNSEALGEVARSLIWVGAMDGLERATAAAEAIGSDMYRAQALGRVARVLAQEGERDRAAKVVERAVAATEPIEDQYTKEFALTTTAVALALTGQFSRAQAAVEEIEDGWLSGHKAYAMTMVAIALLQAGERDGAAKLADRAVAVAEALQRGFDSADALTRVVEVLIEAGDLDRALAVACALSEESLPGAQAAQALTDVSSVLAQEGRLDELHRALTAASAIQRDEYRVCALSGVGRALAQGGEMEWARQAAREATAAMETTDETSKGSAIGYLIPVLVQLGDADGLHRVLMVAEAIRGEWDRAEALGQVASGLVAIDEKGSLDRALAIAEAIDDEGHRVLTLAKLAGSLAHVRKAEQAAEVASRSVTEATFIGEWQTLSEVSWVLAEAGLFDSALAAAQGIVWEDKSARALCEVARRLAQAKEKDGLGHVLTLAQTLQDEIPKANALLKIAWAFSRVGEKAQAAEIASRLLPMGDMIDDHRFRADLLAGACRVLAEAGDMEQAAEAAQCALTSAEAIKMGRSKAYALAEVARALNRAGQKALAGQTLRLSFSTARWFGRGPLLGVLGIGADALLEIGGGQTFWEVYEAVQEVDGWWGLP